MSKDREAALKKGDSVRIVGKRHPFQKGYKGNWTEEIFSVEEVLRSSPFYTYRIAEYDGEPIEGVFHREELQRIKKVQSGEFWQVEKILKTVKTAKGGKKYLVKWYGYPAKYNSWVSEKDMIRR